MKSLLLCCMIASITVVVMSSTPRSFLSFLKVKLRNVCEDVTELKLKTQECCNPKDCTYDGKTHTDGSIFTATDGCNSCICNQGTVVCTNSSSCNQAGSGASYNYKDEIAQAYCAAKFTYSVPDLVSAVRRDCEDTDGPGAAATCESICGSSSPFATEIAARFPELGLFDFRCYAGLWIWMNHTNLAPNPGPGQTDAGLLNMVTISYDHGTACESNECGPNYCCCYASNVI